MILPTKNLDQDRALIEISSELLILLDSPRTISNLWDKYKNFRLGLKKSSITYDWFILAIDFLYIIAVVEYESGKIRKIAGENDKKDI